MCGLVGIASAKALTLSQRKMFRHLLIVDQLRGEHSTGVAIIKSWKDNPQVELVKEVGSPSDLYYYHGKGQSNDLFFGEANILLGHNRYATQGKITVENAHPFDMGRIVGAHNGTLPAYQVNRMEGSDLYDVDSQVLYHHMNHHEGDVKEVFESTDGAMALSWFDKDDKALRFARNSQRPLSFARTTCGALVWASESIFIHFAAIRCGVKLEGETKELEVMKLANFVLNEAGEIHYEEEDLPRYAPKFFQYPNRYQGGGTSYSYTGGDEWDDYSGRSDEKAAGAGQKEEPETSKVVRLETPTDQLPILSGTTTRLIIKEVHRTTEGEGAQAAIGILEGGQEVRINIPVACRKECLDKILGRGQKGGFYVGEKIWKGAIGKSGSPPYFTHWDDLRYITLEESKKVKVLSKGFKIEAVWNIPYYEGKFIKSELEWDAKVQYGCDCCGTVPEVKEHEGVMWIGAFQFLCKGCVESPKFLVGAK